MQKNLSAFVAFLWSSIQFMDTKARDTMPHQISVPDFGSLASFIVTNDDHKTAVYMRFDKLSARNILYYQSDLSHLEDVPRRI